MKRRLIIIGAGNVGGFVCYNYQEFGDYEVVGFLDDDATKHGKQLYGKYVLGGVDTIGQYITNDPLFVAIGISSPVSKRSIRERLAGYPLIFPSLISKNVWASQKVSFGEGTIVYPGVSINYETSVQSFVVINMNCAIGHNCILEAYATLSPGVNLGGFTIVGNSVFMGIGASSKQGIKIGPGAIIGGQSMLIADVAAEKTIVGVPGRAH